MDPRTWKEMVERTRELEHALGNGIKKIEENEKETVVVQRRSLHVKRNLKKSHIITYDDLIALRPCPANSLSPTQLKKVIGRTLLTDISAGDCLKVLTSWIKYGHFNSHKITITVFQPIGLMLEAE